MQITKFLHIPLYFTAETLEKLSADESMVENLFPSMFHYLNCIAFCIGLLYIMCFCVYCSHDYIRMGAGEPV